MPLTPIALRDALRTRLAARVRVVAPTGSGRAAAVLVPLFERDAEVHVWMLRRPAGMRQHSGEVAFPGGKVDAGDTTLERTALREAEEELGFPPARADVLGPLDDVVTGTGFTITPIVAWIPPDIAPIPSPTEVARVFAAPLERFVAAHDASVLTRVYVDGENVWGATLHIARTLGGIVRAL